MPITPFIGVRISWLILAKNSLLARAAFSAASLATFRFSSASLRAVMSRDNPKGASRVKYGFNPVQRFRADTANFAL
jgi:hypothetical protein